MSTETVCRACSQEVAEYELIDVFGGSGFLATIFGQCMSLEIQSDDGLPKHICAECNAKLIGFHKFRTVCRKWDSYFRASVKLELPASPTPSTYVKEDYEEHDMVELIETAEEPDEFVAESVEENLEESGEFYDGNYDDREEVVAAVDCAVPIPTDEPEAKFDPNNLQCDICHQRGFSLDSIEAHMRTHSLKKFPCPECGKRFASETTLKNHIRYSHETIRKPFVCTLPHCTKAYVLHQSLLNHIRIGHERDADGSDKTNGFAANRKPPKELVCEQCGKIFQSISGLKKHSYVHTGELPFACSYCPKRCVTKHKLKEHTMRHEGIKNHVCPVCGLRKTTPHELKVHLNYHTREKLYPCDQCELVFTSIGNLSRHIKIVHSRIKDFACQICDRSFGKADTLKHHIMTHTGERPHRCAICGKRFIQRIALRTHMGIHQKREAALSRAAVTDQREQ